MSEVWRPTSSRLAWTAAVDHGLALVLDLDPIGIHLGLDGAGRTQLAVAAKVAVH